MLTHPAPGLSSMPPDVPFGSQDLLEKPLDKADNYRMLLDLNGGISEVVTGVSVGASRIPPVPYTDSS